MEGSHCSILEDPRLRSLGLFSFQKNSLPLLIFREPVAGLILQYSRGVREPRGLEEVYGRSKREEGREREREREREKENRIEGRTTRRRVLEHVRVLRRGLMSVVET